MARKQSPAAPGKATDTFRRGSAFLQREAKTQVVCEAKYKFRKDDDVHWQPRGARQPERSGDSPALLLPNKPGQTAKASPQGERGGVHQFYTSSCDVRCFVEMLTSYTALRGRTFLQSEASPQVVSAAKDNSRIYDPANGSGGCLPASSLCGVRFAEKDRAYAQAIVKSTKFVEPHGGTGHRDTASSKSEATLPSMKGNRGDISIYGKDKGARQERTFDLATRALRVRLRWQQPKLSNATTRRQSSAKFVLGVVLGLWQHPRKP